MYDPYQTEELDEEALAILEHWEQERRAAKAQKQEDQRNKSKKNPPNQKQELDEEVLTVLEQWEQERIAAEAQKRKVGKAIWRAILFLGLSSVIAIVATVILAFLVGVLSSIPILGTIIGWLLPDGWNYDNIGPLLRIVAIIIGYAVSGLVAYNNLNRRTERLTLRIIGITLIVVHAISLLVNLFAGDNFYLNVIQLIAGGWFYYTGKE